MPFSAAVEAHMRTWVAVGMLAVWLAAAPAAAQYQPADGRNADSGQPSVYQPAGPPAAGPDQRVAPQDPRFERRAEGLPPGGNQQNPAGQGGGPPGAPPQPRAPFVLTPQEEAILVRVLQFWEQRSVQIKTFRCKFFRIEYLAAFADPNQPNKPRSVDKGEIYYSAPDKGMFKVEEPRPEHWICNGKAVYQYDFQQKRVLEHKLPPELQGKGITDGPLPFIFGAKADQLKRRYWMRITTPPDAKSQVWLEVYPKFQQDAANFRRVDLILSTENMLPYAIQMHDPGGQSRVVFQFPPETLVVNGQNLRNIFEDPFNPRVPRGWKMEDGDAPQVGGPARQAPPALGNRPGPGPR